MRSHEERVAETKRRIAKIEREKRLRRDKITMISAAGGVPCAACRRVPRHARHCRADTDRRLFRL